MTKSNFCKLEKKTHIVKSSFSKYKVSFIVYVSVENVTYTQRKISEVEKIAGYKNHHVSHICRIYFFSFFSLSSSFFSS